jgi:protein-glucosylgalactosylhydroxylysine glucosidase
LKDHPSVLGTYGMLPVTKGLDKKVMHKTFEKIWDNWQWNETRGWDFAMAAMTASRLGYPEKAVDRCLCL